MYSSSHAVEYSVSECPQIRPKWRHNNIETAPNCPRCASSNTKFCYYNNYSLSQPRYFCKGCRRYWTKGGSLRNVPVGGGCRKSRRARATREAAGAASCAASTLAAAGCMGSAAEPERGAEIDLAAVFAKYVNPNIVEREESCSPGGSSGSSDNVQTNSLEIDGQMDDITLFFDQYQKPTDLRNGADNQLQQVIPQFSTHEGINGQDFVYQECNGFGLQQGLIGEEPGAEILWSEGTNLPNFECQQRSMVQLQDFGIFSPDDQLRISANLLSNDWGSFDPSANGFF